MKFDVVFVTYNSEKWIDGCIKSIEKSKYNLKNVNLIFYDNNSIDDTLTKLKKYKKNIGEKFEKFEIIEGNQNKGFGYGNNIGSKYGNSDYIFFLNIDTNILEDTFMNLEKEILNSKDEVGMWELRQAPYEHPKYYDPVTGYTSWASGACMIVKRDIFEKLGGFDDKIFMYCEDVELSWNFRKNNFKIKYLPNIKIFHYSYNEKYEFKYNQFLYGFLSNMYIRAKYGTLKNYFRGVQYVYRMSFKGENIPLTLDKKIVHKIKKNGKRYLFKNFIPLLIKNIFKNDSNFKPTFINGLDYEINRVGAFYEVKEVKNNPLVSIIVRTCGRPDILRETLISLKKQTYNNIEIIVVEDGKSVAKKMIEKEFSDCNIVYKPTDKKVGRSAAGNIGMKLAKGKYLNFLDDDDVFFPDHVEVLVSELENNNYDIVYSSSFETRINVESKKPYKYDIIDKGLFGFGIFSRFRLYKHNLFPIQSVMFKKSLFEECGGLDENIDALEDWDFWIRLSLKSDFNPVEKTTSIFRTPANRENQESRGKFLDSTLEYLYKKFRKYKLMFSVDDFNKM